jgi:hypothetical protein
MGPPPTWRGQFGTRWWPASQATWPVGWVERPPPTQASPCRVDVWQSRLGLNRFKPWPDSRPLSSLGLGSSPLGPHVKYITVVMIILTFGQLHFSSIEMLQFGT